MSQMMAKQRAATMSTERCESLARAVTRSFKRLDVVNSLSEGIDHCPHLCAKSERTSPEGICNSPYRTSFVLEIQNRSDQFRDPHIGLGIARRNIFMLSAIVG